MLALTAVGLASTGCISGRKPKLQQTGAPTLKHEKKLSAEEEQNILKQTNRLFAAGLAAEQQNDYRAAEAAYNECVKYGQSNESVKYLAPPYHRLGVLNWRQRKNRESENYFRKAIEISADNPELACDFAQMLCDENREDEAEVILKNTLITSPSNKKLLFFLGHVYAVRDNSVGGLRYMKMAVSESQAYREIADIHRARGDQRGAEFLESKALAAEKKRPKPLDSFKSEMNQEFAISGNPDMELLDYADKTPSIGSITMKYNSLLNEESERKSGSDPSSQTAVASNLPTPAEVLQKYGQPYQQNPNQSQPNANSSIQPKFADINPAQNNQQNPLVATDPQSQAQIAMRPSIAARPNPAQETPTIQTEQNRVIETEPQQQTLVFPEPNLPLLSFEETEEKPLDYILGDEPSGSDIVADLNPVERPVPKSYSDSTKPAITIDHNNDPRLNPKSDEFDPFDPELNEMNSKVVLNQTILDQANPISPKTEDSGDSFESELQFPILAEPLTESKPTLSESVEIPLLEPSDGSSVEHGFIPLDDKPSEPSPKVDVPEFKQEVLPEFLFDDFSSSVPSPDSTQVKNLIKPAETSQSQVIQPSQPRKNNGSSRPLAGVSAVNRPASKPNTPITSGVKKEPKAEPKNNVINQDSAKVVKTPEKSIETPALFDEIQTETTRVAVNPLKSEPKLTENTTVETTETSATQPLSPQKESIAIPAMVLTQSDAQLSSNLEQNLQKKEIVPHIPELGAIKIQSAPTVLDQKPQNETIPAVPVVMELPLMVADSVVSDNKPSKVEQESTTVVPDPSVLTFTPTHVVNNEVKTKIEAKFEPKVEPKSDKPIAKRPKLAPAVAEIKLPKPNDEVAKLDRGTILDKKQDVIPEFQADIELTPGNGETKLAFVIAEEKRTDPVVRNEVVNDTASNETEDHNIGDVIVLGKGDSGKVERTVMESISELSEDASASFAGEMEKTGSQLVIGETAPKRIDRRIEILDEVSGGDNSVETEIVLGVNLRNKRVDNTKTVSFGGEMVEFEFKKRETTTAKPTKPETDSKTIRLTPEKSVKMLEVQQSIPAAQLKTIPLKKLGQTVRIEDEQSPKEKSIKLEVAADTKSKNETSINLGEKNSSKTASLTLERF